MEQFVAELPSELDRFVTYLAAIVCSLANSTVLKPEHRSDCLPGSCTIGLESVGEAFQHAKQSSNFEFHICLVKSVPEDGQSKSKSLITLNKRPNIRNIRVKRLPDIARTEQKPTATVRWDQPKGTAGRCRGREVGNFD